MRIRTCTRCTMDLWPPSAAYYTSLCGCSTDTFTRRSPTRLTDTSTGTIRHCRPYLARYVGSQDIKSDIVRPRESWAFRIPMLNCPHCEQGLTPHEIGVLYAAVGRTQNSKSRRFWGAKL